MAKNKQAKTPDELFLFRCPFCRTSGIVIETPSILCPYCGKRFGWMEMRQVRIKLRPDEREKFEAEYPARKTHGS
jgi:hypothetical protein